MSRARVLVLLVAIACAVLAAMLARGMIGQPPDVVNVEPPPAATVPILIAAKDLAVGERLNGLSVEWREWPRGNVASSMITRKSKPNAIEEIEGARARQPILVGEPIAERKIVTSKSGNLMSALVPKGLRAVGIRISDRTGAGGFILPNDRVDIIANRKVELYERGNSDEKTEVAFSRIIVTNVRVLAINRTIASDGIKSSLPDLETAVVELTPLQAEIVMRSETQGELALALRSFEEGGDGGLADEMPKLSEATDDPFAVNVYKSGFRQILSCQSNCDPTVDRSNSPFPLIVRDGVEPPATPR